MPKRPLTPLEVAAAEAVYVYVRTLGELSLNADGYSRARLFMGLTKPQLDRAIVSLAEAGHVKLTGMSGAVIVTLAPAKQEHVPEQPIDAPPITSEVM